MVFSQFNLLATSFTYELGLAAFTGNLHSVRLSTNKEFHGVPVTPLASSVTSVVLTGS